MSYNILILFRYNGMAIDSLGIKILLDLFLPKPHSTGYTFTVIIPGPPTQDKSERDRVPIFSGKGGYFRIRSRV
jgi:hypothetical protein